MDSQTKTAVKKTEVLITVSGIDKPGITSAITGILAQSQVRVLDIAQAVIHNLLSLSILFEMENGDQTEETVIKDLLFKANELKLKLKFRLFESDSPQAPSVSAKPFHYAITLISGQISASALHEVTKTLAKYETNIDVIKRLSDLEFSCVEMLVSSAEKLPQRALKKHLLEIARSHGVDIALQAEGLYRRAKRLVVLDMDSTLIQNEVIDELARRKGVFDEVSKITHAAMSGLMNYDESLAKRCEKLKGLKLSDIDAVFNEIKLTPGAKDLIHVLKKLGYKIAIISGGFSCIADRFKEQLGIDFAYSNALEIKNGELTGRVLPPIVNAQRKADLVDVIAQQEKIDLDQVIAIGDGANDILMLEKAGLGIAFNAKPAVSAKADFSINQKNLRSILYLLGLSGRDLLEAGLVN
jgi:phosphoserine phosphatase